MSQRRRLLALLLAVTLPLVGLAVLFVVTSVQESRERAREDAVSSARAGALAADSYFSGHQRTLRAIAFGMRTAGDLTEPELRVRLLEATDANPEWDGMSVVGPDGIVIAGTRETSAGADLSEREYLQRLFATGETVVTDGVLTLVESVPAVLIGTPIDFEDGSRGAVVGSVALSTLSRVLTETLAPSARVGLIDSAGNTLVHPDPARVAALLNVADRPEVIAGLAGETGTVHAEREGEPALAAFAPVTSLGWAVTVVESQASVYANADAIARRGAIFIALAMTAVLVGGWALGGRMNRSHAAMLAAQQSEVQARTRAEAALQSRDEFISIASHELRNPVAAIRGYGQLMQRRLDRGALTPEDVREYADSIATSGAYLSRLVEDLLNVSRLEGRQVELRIEEVDVIASLRRAIEEAPLSAHVLRTEVPDEPLLAEVDPDRLHQILASLLENAAKYAPAGSEVLVEARPADEDAIELAVTDHGIGLPRSEADRLFKPFGRASNAREANIPGLGMGLYVSGRLAEAHGGTLVGFSDGEGHGATFTLRLPRTQGATRSATQSGTQGKDATTDDNGATTVGEPRTVSEGASASASGG